MLDELANLSKTIDGFISGIIEFAYSILSTVVRIYVNPLRGALRPRIIENNVSSKTLLFLVCSAVIAYISYGENAARTLMKASSPSLFAYILIVILFYVTADLCVLLLSLACARRKRRRRARELLRFTLAAVLGGWGFVVPMLFYVDEKLISPGKVFGNFFLIIESLPFVAALLAYPLFVLVFILIRNRGLRRVPGLAASGVLGMGALALLVAVLFLQPRDYVDSLFGEGGDQAAEDDSPRLVGISCEEHRDSARLEIRAAVYNPADAPVVLGRRALKASVGPGGETPPTFSIAFPRAGEPLAVIEAKAVNVVAFDQPIDAPLRKSLAGPQTCTISLYGDEDSAQAASVEAYPEDGATVQYGSGS